VDLTTNPQDSVETRNYKNLMNKEFAFCLKILPLIIQKANEIYDKQISTGKITNFCCNFRLLEEKSKKYPTK
ncbi:type III toxin-antitoxin system ToxN/AbiQ family toxin, partial [bacterium]|nr:type III toxin-antitoxin system ToxN/AbiQ family toxin [bacterium]